MKFQISRFEKFWEVDFNLFYFESSWNLVWKHLNLLIWTQKSLNQIRKRKFRSKFLVSSFLTQTILRPSLFIWKFLPRQPISVHDPPGCHGPFLVQSGPPLVPVQVAEPAHFLLLAQPRPSCPSSSSGRRSSCRLLAKCRRRLLTSPAQHPLHLEKWNDAAAPSISPTPRFPSPFPPPPEMAAPLKPTDGHHSPSHPGHSAPSEAL
jgi:hypothetical protein